LSYVDTNGKQRYANPTDIGTGSLFQLPDNRLINIPDGTDANAGINVQVSRYLPGIYGASQCGLLAAPGQVCSATLGNLPTLNFTNTATAADANFAFEGVFSDKTGSANFRGSIDMQFPGYTFQDILKGFSFNTLYAGPATGDISFGLPGAESPVPEPAPVFEVLAVGVVVALAKWKSMVSGLRRRQEHATS
jgi:hypothetical protein